MAKKTNKAPDHTTLTKKDLVKAAKNVTKVMGIDPPIDPKADEDELKKKLIKALAFVDPTDKFTETTDSVLELLAPLKDDPEWADENDENDDENENAEADDDADDEDEDEDEDEDDTPVDYEAGLEALEGAKKLKEIKEIAEEAGFDEELGKHVGKAKKMVKVFLQEKIDSADTPDADDADDADDDDDDASVETPAQKKKREKAEKKVAPPKKDSGPGVIASILEFITKAKKGLTKDEIADKLEERFSERERDTMLKTVKAQLGGKKSPCRMEREKDVEFKIKDEKYSIK